MEIDEGHGSKEGKPTNTADNPVPRNLKEDITVSTHQQVRQQHNHSEEGHDNKKQENGHQTNKLHFKTVEVKKEKLDEAENTNGGKYKRNEDVVMLTPDALTQDVDMDSDDDSQSLKRKYEKGNTPRAVKGTTNYNKFTIRKHSVTTCIIWGKCNYYG